MKTLRSCGFSIIFFVVTLLIYPSRAHSIGIGLQAGMSKGGGTPHNSYKTWSPFYSSSFTFGLKHLFEMGAFFDQNPLSPTTGSVRFYGGILKLGVGPVSDLFLEFKVGQTQTYETSGTSRAALGFGGALGYDFTLVPLFLTLGPKLGYRMLPADFSESGGPSGNRSYLDLSAVLMLSLW